VVLCIRKRVDLVEYKRSKEEWRGRKGEGIQMKRIRK